MKQFKNKIGVIGTPALRKAFREELLILGWKQQGKDEIEEKPCIYCSSTGKHSLEKDHFWYPDTIGNGKDAYKLPEQYEEALKAASEVVEEIPEYVECIQAKSTLYNNFTVGKIYKTIKLEGTILTTTNDLGKTTFIPSVLDKSGKITGDTDFKPSTKEAYDAQNKPVFKVGDWVVVTDTIKKGSRSNKNKAVGHIFQLDNWGDYNSKKEVEGLNEGKEIVSPDNKYGINYIKDWLRLATPEEIAEVTKPKEETTLTLGTSNIKITVYKNGKVEAEGRRNTIKTVKHFINLMEGGLSAIGWEISYPSIKIGCSTFTLDELKQIVTAHDKLNPSEW